MSQQQHLSRRGFAAFALVTAGTLAAADTNNDPITQASVPADPDAPKVQPGTQPEDLPFSRPLQFSGKLSDQKVLPFAMQDVRLLPGNAFYQAQEADRQLLHRLPADRLLHTFRLNSGIPSNVEPLGGWEKPDCELRGHFTGHFLSACALMHASTGDADLKAKGDGMVAELAKCQQRFPGGYLSAFPIELFDRLKARRPVWAPFYTVHKIMAGMMDMHRHCANQQALEVLKGMADWTGTWTAALSVQQMQMVLDTEYGGMNDVLYQLAAATGEERYAAVGDRFTKQRFFNPLALRRDQLRGLHTNTHIPQVIGAAERFELTSDGRFHDVAKNFWDEVIQGRTYVTGGTSNNEGWLVEPNHLAQELHLGSSTNECCCAYNMLKLTRHLYTWSVDPRYFDYYERALFNHRLGTIDNQTGLTQYYLGLVPGSWRTFATELNTFWCCTGTGVEEYSKLNDSIYFHAQDALYVNLFIPSEVNWREKNIRVTQTNNFPATASSHFKLELQAPRRFALNLRIPCWVAGFAGVKVNGVPMDVSSAPGSYLSLLRTWNDGDQVELELPMHLRREAMPDDPSMQAVLFGPLVLGSELGGVVEAPLIDGHAGPDFKKYPAAGNVALNEPVQVTADPLVFQSGDRKLIPFHQIPAGRTYTIYWRA